MSDAIDLPFSAQLFDLYQQVERCTTPKERFSVMMRLAMAFAAEHDFTDAGLTEEHHLEIREYEQARYRYEQTSLSVARLALDSIRMFLESNGVSREVPPQGTPVN